MYTHALFINHDKETRNAVKIVFNNYYFTITSRSFGSTKNDSSNFPSTGTGASTRFITYVLRAKYQFISLSKGKGKRKGHCNTIKSITSSSNPLCIMIHPSTPFAKAVERSRIIFLRFCKVNKKFLFSINWKPILEIFR